MIPQSKSTYIVTLKPGFICLVDLDNGMSLTNAAESVIQQLAQQGFDLTHNRIIYQDTMGQWDELVVQDGRFVGFAPLRATSQAQAIRNATQAPCTAPENAAAEFFAE